MSNLRIPMLNIILNFIYSRGWTNYDDFAQELAEGIITEYKSKGKLNLHESLNKAPSSFFTLNQIPRGEFLATLAPRIEKEIAKLASEARILRIVDLFPEIGIIDESEARLATSKLRIDESILQDAFRAAFRSKGGSPIPQRGKDSPLEVADIEYFTMQFHGDTISLAAVIKGYNSIRNTRVSWEDVAHQVVRAHMMGEPDYVVVAIAKEPKDSLITYLKLYALSVEKPNLVLFVPPIDLARLLRYMKVI